MWSPGSPSVIRRMWGVKMGDMDECIKNIESCIDDLHSLAYNVADRYWLFVNEHESKNTGTDSYSNLELTCGKKGNHLKVRWQAIEWHGRKNARSRIRLPIARDEENMTYQKSVLKSKAKDWEWPMVKETELQLQSIRRQAHHLFRSNMSIRSAKQVRRVLEAKH